MTGIITLKMRLSLLAVATCVTITQLRAQQPGITDTTIKLGTQAPMSGPVP